MSKIKSALELALEKTADVSVDREAVRRDASVKEGRMLAGRYLSDPGSVDLKKALSETDRKERDWVKEGAAESLLANLTLPRYENDIDRLPVLAEALAAIAENPGAVGGLMKQIGGLFGQFMDNFKALDEQLRDRWEPRLRQKEQALRQQTGQSVRLTADQDPEFAKVLGDELSRMESQYVEVIAQAKSEIKKLL